MTSQTKLIHGRWVITGAGNSDDVIDTGAVLVTGADIAEIGAMRDLRERHPDAELIGGDRFAVLPGLVNAHHHAGGVTKLQQGLSDMLLEPWIFAHLALRPADIELSTLLSTAQLLKSGVTTVVDVQSGRGTAKDYSAQIGKTLSVYDEAGIRVALAAGITTQSHFVHGAGQDEQFLASLPGDLRARLEALLPGTDAVTEAEYLAIIEEHWRAHREHPRIDLWFAPPGPQWVSDDFMQKIAESAQRLDTNIQTHVTESLYEKLHGPRFYGRNTMEHLHSLGVLSPHFSIAHGVWLTQAEIALMAETGAAISHNPSSNLRLRAGIAPLNSLVEAGVTTGLGMDGTTLNDDNDMFTEMRLAMRLHRTPKIDDPAPTPARVFEMATAGGAKLMCRENRIGRIASGFVADLVLVDLERVTWPWIAPEVDPRDLLLMRAGAGDVDTVLVDGAVVLRSGQPTGFDIAEVGREIAGRLAAEPRPTAMHDLVQAIIPRLEDHYQSWAVPAPEPYSVYNSRR